jgi:membrane protein DedA with SNARE-associated domain
MVLYGVILVCVVIENFFPPSPSDVFVVFAAFLSHRGGMQPLSIFLVAWGGSVSGAAVVYGSTRRFGRRFLQSALGRRLLPPAAYAAVEREYLRFGVAGMFFFRLLPGFRAFVAPFAGLAHLGVIRAMLPMILASGLWFAGLVLLGGTLGSRWDTIATTLGRLNRTLAIVSGAVLVALVLYVRHRIRAHRRTRLEAARRDGDSAL